VSVEQLVYKTHQIVFWGGQIAEHAAVARLLVPTMWVPQIHAWNMILHLNSDIAMSRTGTVQEAIAGEDELASQSWVYALRWRKRQTD
jgi:hypothetical protein